MQEDFRLPQVSVGWALGNCGSDVQAPPMLPWCGFNFPHNSWSKSPGTSWTACC